MAQISEHGADPFRPHPRQDACEQRQGIGHSIVDFLTSQKPDWTVGLLIRATPFTGLCSSERPNSSAKDRALPSGCGKRPFPLSFRRGLLVCAAHLSMKARG